MEQKLLKKDFYEAVNGEWLSQATIPADKPATGGFQDLVEGVEKQLMADIKKMAILPEHQLKKELVHFISYYRLANDYQMRDTLGAKPLVTFLARIQQLTSYSELNQQLADWVLKGYPLPFRMDVDADMKNASYHAFFAEAPTLFLPDKTYYEATHPNGKQLLDVFSKMVIALLQLTGFSNSEAIKINSEALAFDQLLAPHVKSAEEAADYSKMYHPKSLDTFASYTKTFDLKALSINLLGKEPEQVIVTDPGYFEHLQEILSEANFARFKSWLIVVSVRALSPYLSEEFRQTAGIYTRTLSGTDEAMSAEKAAYYLAIGQFDQVIGDYYGKNYFGEAAKQDVYKMVEQMINVYEKRLKENTWLSQQTKEKAIRKLAHLGIQVGYPDQVPQRFSNFKTKSKENGGTLLENTLDFYEIDYRYRLRKFEQPVDRTEWEMSANTVNAYYHPFRNVIVFPAAILQAPFYSLKQSSAANFGGIGAVIAHEISHAFDNNGALFDELGNLNNWWTEEDFKQFKQRAKDMITQFDGLSFAGGTVNGTLTVSENIADAGGLSCALEAAKEMNDVDIQAFFVNWATIWRTKAKTAYQQLLLQIDVHAPAKLRANIQPQNLADFYTAFDISAGDAMYLPPEKRVHIW